MASSSGVGYDHFHQIAARACRGGRTSSPPRPGAVRALIMRVHANGPAREQLDARRVFARRRAGALQPDLPRHHRLQRQLDLGRDVADQRHRAALAHATRSPSRIGSVAPTASRATSAPRPSGPRRDLRRHVARLRVEGLVRAQLRARPASLRVVDIDGEDAPEPGDLRQPASSAGRSCPRPPRRLCRPANGASGSPRAPRSRPPRSSPRARTPGRQAACRGYSAAPTRTRRRRRSAGSRRRRRPAPAGCRTD